MSKHILALKGVAKLFERKLVFKEVSFAVDPGEIWLVVGPNGAGKSTLLKVMAGLMRADRGGVENNLEPGEIAYLGHNTFIYPRLTARENLQFWGKLHGVDVSDKRLNAVLERVGLAHAAEERAGKFSRGMAQRLSLARVFLQEPKLIFLDEPGTGLDARSMTVLDGEIRAARERGASLVWVSHNVRRDLALVDKVLYLSGRRPKYVGPASDFTPEGDIC